MDIVTNVVSFAAMFSPIVAVVAAVIVYAKFRNPKMGAGRRSVLLFALGALLVGGAIGWLGALVGVGIFCSLYSGAQCGLGGIFFAAPLAFTLAVSAYLYFWAKRDKAP